MRFWRYMCAGSLALGLALMPKEYETKLAHVPAMDDKPEVASLHLEKNTPTLNLPARSPISLFGKSANKPLSGITICIDPGHGGQGQTKTHYTGGTIGVVTGQTEGDVNLRVSLILRQYLQAAGAKVVMTRLSDNRCQGDACKREELDFRSNIANRSKADFFISVHHNYVANKPDINYTAVFYPQGDSQSHPLAANISSAVSRYLGIRNVGAKQGDYRVLNKINMPGVIVEASFMTNPQEDLRLANLSYNKLEAKAIATGILNYFRATRNTNVDFQGIFAPLDDQAGSAQQIADATMIKTNVVEQKSLFGSRYKELTYGKSGQVVQSRNVGSSTLAARKTTKASTNRPASSQVTKIVADSKKNVASKSKTVSKNSGTKTISKPIVSSSKSKEAAAIASSASKEASNAKSSKSVAASKTSFKRYN